MNILKSLFRSQSEATTSVEKDLLDSIRVGAIPDPTALRAQLDSLNGEIAALDAEWEALDGRADASAYLQRQPVAERLQALRLRAAPLPDQIAHAERRRDAFLRLVRLFDAVAAEVSARTLHLLEYPAPVAGERADQLQALDRETRIHVRLATRLARLSSAPQFREPPDAIRVLRDDLDARIRELDRLRSPGSRRPVEWPAPMLSLLAIVEDTEARKDQSA